MPGHPTAQAPLCVLQYISNNPPKKPPGGLLLHRIARKSPMHPQHNRPSNASGASSSATLQMPTQYQMRNEDLQPTQQQNPPRKLEALRVDTPSANHRWQQPLGFAARSSCLPLSKHDPGQCLWFLLPHLPPCFPRMTLGSASVVCCPHSLPATQHA